MTYCHQLLDQDVPTIGIHDTVDHAMLVAEECMLAHLPVLDGHIYQGMISQTDLEDANPEDTLSNLQHLFIKPFVRGSDHFIHSLRMRSRFQVDLVPVLNEQQEWEGGLGASVMLDQLSQMTGVNAPGALIILEMPRHDYAPGELNRLVESNDAMILQMNTWEDPATGHLQVILRLNREEVSDVMATLQRHEYQVVFHYGDESYDNALQHNLDHLMNYLNI